MTDTHPASRRNERPNLWGAIITLIIEAALVAGLAIVGIGISFLMLQLTG